MYSPRIPLILSMLSITAFAAPAPQYSPIALAASTGRQQHPSKYPAAPAAPVVMQNANAAQQYYPDSPTPPAPAAKKTIENAQEYPEFSIDPATPVTTQYSNPAQQYSTDAPTAPAVPASQGYICYKGLDFPRESHWLSFSALQMLNLPMMKIGNEPETVPEIFQAILAVSEKANIDPRIVLAMVMQESSGQTFKNGDFQQSSGLMQVQPLNGEQGILCSPTECTLDKIIGMIDQGVLGTTRGDGPVAPGIAYWLQRYKLATALRAYNSGQIPNWNDLSIATDRSTASYVSDIGNRLTGLAPEKFLLSRSATCGFAPTPNWA